MYMPLHRRSSALASLARATRQRVLMKFGVATDIVYWHEKLVAISREISAQNGRKTCVKVFVTFETETSQRECLKAMTTGETTPVRPARE